jgi:lysozyme family protein
MKDNFDGAFSHVMQSEGGYVNDPKDPGGETNLGVTKAAWADYIGRPVADGEMKELTKDVVKPFYKKMYWDKVHGDDLPKGLDYLAFDFAVNAGTGQAAKFIQRAVGATADGAIGPATLALVTKTDPRTLILGFTNQKEMFYKDLAERKPDLNKFLKGWLVRTSTVAATAQTMLA